MSLQPPVLPPSIRIAQSSLTDAEFAFIMDLLQVCTTYQLDRLGWSMRAVGSYRHEFTEAAKIRGIKDGVRVVTQTVDLRY